MGSSVRSGSVVGQWWVSGFGRFEWFMRVMSADAWCMVHVQFVYWTPVQAGCDPFLGVEWHR